jgi:hypothetical protein|tara:strand:- start:20317 stop:20493 length:177 start_codon:yes stop_codon:yes gene_type:complete
MTGRDYQMKICSPIIGNIQVMSKKIGNELSFEYLNEKSYPELQKIQDELIPQYNNSIK